jgi:hypothetical protein
MLLKISYNYSESETGIALGYPTPFVSSVLRIVAFNIVFFGDLQSI